MNAVVKEQRWCAIHGAPQGQYESRTHAYECLKCREHNHANGGRRKAQPKREPGLPEAERFEYMGRFPEKSFEKYLERLMDDPVRLAAAMADSRRPRGVDRSRHGVAIRSAMREPMLNADPQAIRNGFLLQAPKSRVPKGRVYRYVLVKPSNYKVAEKAGGWHSREWVVFTLKFTKGLVIVTNKGDESKVFMGWGSMQEAIEKSGWEIIR